MPCSTTASATVGSNCAVTTSADAVLGDPSAVLEGARATWQLGAVDVLDGGPDDTASTADNSRFETQGVLVP